MATNQDHDMVDLPDQDEKIELVDELPEERDEEDEGKEEKPKAEGSEKGEGEGGTEGEDESEEAEPKTRYEKRLYQLLAERKQHDEEVAALRAEVEQLRQRQTEKPSEPEESEAAREIKGLIADLDARLAEEDDDATMRSVIKAQKLSLQQELKRETESAEQKRKSASEADSEQYDKPVQSAPRIHPEAQKWMDRNPWYNARDKYGQLQHGFHRNVATQEYQRLLQRYGDNTPELFEELDSLIKRAPEFEDVVRPPASPRKPGRQNTSPGTANDSGSSGISSREPRLTERDLRNIRDVMKRDPNDPEARKVYMKYNTKFRGAQ